LKDGTDIQRFLCKACSYRFSESSVKVNVARKVVESSNSGKNHHKVRVASCDGSKEKVNDSLPFAFGENVSSHNLSIVEKDLNNFPFHNRDIQVCAQKDAKNLETTTETKIVAGDLETLQKRKGRFVKFLSVLENDGIHESSAKLYVAYLERIESSGGNLLDSESVKATIAKKKMELGNQSTRCCSIQQIPNRSRWNVETSKVPD
jgi:hypothetical protein